MYIIIVAFLFAIKLLFKQIRHLFDYLISLEFRTFQKSQKH